MFDVQYVYIYIVAGALGCDHIFSYHTWYFGVQLSTGCHPVYTSEQLSPSCHPVYTS